MHASKHSCPPRTLVEPNIIYVHPAAVVDLPCLPSPALLLHLAGTAGGSERRPIPSPISPALTMQVDQNGGASLTVSLTVSLFSLGGITWTDVSIPAPPSTPASVPAPPPALAPTESSSTGSPSRRMLLQAGTLLPAEAPPRGPRPPRGGIQPPQPKVGGPPGSDPQPSQPAAGGPPDSSNPQPGGPPSISPQPPRRAAGGGASGSARADSSCSGAIMQNCATRVVPPIGERGCCPQ